MTVDLGKFAGFDEAQDEGIDVEILDPDKRPFLGDDGKPWIIRVAGPDSARARKSQQRLTGIYMRRRGAPSDEEIAAETPLILADLTISWTPAKISGEDFPYTHANAVRLYSTFGFIARQVNEVANDVGRFFQKWQKNSAAPSEAKKE